MLLCVVTVSFFTLTLSRVCVLRIPSVSYKVAKCVSEIGCLTSHAMIFQLCIWRHIDVEADWKISRCVCETLRYAPGGNKVRKAIFSFKVKVKVTRSLTLVSFERASLVEYACQISSLYLLLNIKSLSLTPPPVRARRVKSRMCTSVSPAWS